VVVRKFGLSNLGQYNGNLENGVYSVVVESYGKPEQELSKMRFKASEPVWVYLNGNHQTFNMSLYRWGDAPHSGADRDGAVDDFDSEDFQQCYGGAGRPVNCVSDMLSYFDHDEDGDVDGTDYGMFAENYTKPKTNELRCPYRFVSSGL